MPTSYLLHESEVEALRASHRAALAALEAVESSLPAAPPVPRSRAVALTMAADGTQGAVDVAPVYDVADGGPLSFENGLREAFYAAAEADDEDEDQATPQHSLVHSKAAALANCDALYAYLRAAPRG